MGVWNSGRGDVDRDFVLLGRSQKNGACAASGAWLFARNIQPRGPHHARPNRDGLCFHFGLLGTLGNEQRVEWTLQAEKMNLHWFGMDLLAAQVQTANPILILIFIPLVNYVIYPAINRVFPLTPLRKIGIGLFLTGLSFMVIVWIQGQIDAGLRPTINWQLLAYVILTLGEAMVSITGLEFSYTQSPNSMKSSVMALWLLTVASGEFFVGKVNAWDLNADGTRKLTDYQYFTFFTILMFAAAVVFVVVACFYKGRTYLQTQQLTLDEIATEPILHGGTPS